MAGYLGALCIGLGLYLVINGLARKPAVTAETEPDELPDPSLLDARSQELDTPLATRLLQPWRSMLVNFGSRLRPGGQVGTIKKLDAAGLSIPAEAFYALKFVVAAILVLVALLVVALLGYLTSPRGVAALVVSGVLGFASPNIWLLNSRQKRQQQMSRELPEGLDLLALTVRAGLGLEQGIAEVSREIPGPLGQELDRMLREEQLGRTRREAIEALKDRNPDEDMQRLTGALLHADRLGTPISQTLQTQARELRRRRRARARERAGKAPVKLLVPLILFVFPSMFVVIIGPGIIGILENIV